jgi:hypothetical protein
MDLFSLKPDPRHTLAPDDADDVWYVTPIADDRKLTVCLFPYHAILPLPFYYVDYGRERVSSVVAGVIVVHNNRKILSQLSFVAQFFYIAAHICTLEKDKEDTTFVRDTFL